MLIVEEKCLDSDEEGELCGNQNDDDIVVQAVDIDGDSDDDNDNDNVDKSRRRAAIEKEGMSMETARNLEEEEYEEIASADGNEKRSYSFKDQMGLVRDGLGAAQPAVDTGFGIAFKSVSFGFMVAKAGVSLLNVVKGGEIISTPINAALDMAHGITKASLHVSKGITDVSLRGADVTLGLVTNAEKGEVLRRLRAHVESQRGQAGFEHKEALLVVSELLVELQGRLTVKDPILLLNGARRLALVHEMQRDRRKAQRWEEEQNAAAAMGHVEEACKNVPTQAEMEVFRSCMNFAAAAYGPFGCFKHGIVKSMSLDQYAVLREVAGIPARDLLHTFQGGTREIFRPTHFVALDRRNRRVVLAIGGTQSVEDVLVDLVCETDTFVIQAARSSSSSSTPTKGEQQQTVFTLSGRVHQGMLRSAQRLAGELHELVMEALRENPDFELVLTGHSLGAGVATVLTLLWAQIPEFANHNIHAYAFAAPCTLSSELSQHPHIRKHVSSIVAGDDIVSRLGIATFRELQSHMVALAQCSERDTLEHYELVLRSMRDEPLGDDKLYCAGQVWWLESQEMEPHPIVEIDPVQELKSMELFDDIIACHMPKSFMKMLARL